MYLETLKKYDYENEILVWTVVETTFNNKSLSFQPLQVINEIQVNDSWVVVYTREEYLNPSKQIHKYIDQGNLDVLYSIAHYYGAQNYVKKYYKISDACSKSIMLHSNNAPP